MDLNKQFTLTKSELSIALLIFVMVSGLVLGSRLMRLTSGKAVHFPNQTTLVFEGSANVDTLLNKLKTLEIEVEEDELQWAANLLGWRNYQRGRYELDGSYSYNNLLSKLARGIQDPVSIVVLPGINPQLLANYVANRMHFNPEDFLGALSDSSLLAEQGMTEEELFGKMFPETYHMYWTASPQDVVKRILRQYNQEVIQPLTGRAEELGITLDEALAMASIIEWEANLEEEKATVSGLYWNRLHRGMRLQADPTVNFAIGERRRLLFEDYRFEHRYNTYIHGGLPPGPITNPSLSSIRAALYPEQHNYLYMVARPDGGHTFTRTFAEHREESEKWRRWLQQQYRIKAQQEAAEQASQNSP